MGERPLTKAVGTVIQGDRQWWFRTVLSPRDSRSLLGRTRRPWLAWRAVIGGLLIGFVPVGTWVPADAVAKAGWSVVPSANLGPGSSANVLQGVSCASASSCTAVGYYWDNSGVYKTLVESWNGTSWSVVPSPSPGRASSSDELQGVSCASASSCTAVGYSGYKTLVESWNGTRWSVVPSPNERPASSANALQGVSCASASSCTAVGYSGYRTLVESWDGTRWSVVPSPNERPASSANALQGVSCASASSCTAVGYYNRGGVPSTSRTLVESWDGTSWSIVASPNEAPASSANALQGVSCASASSCTAVGYSGYRALVESWNGTSWSVVPSPNERPGSTNDLYGVSCTSASSCTAVGYSSYETLVESWDGTSWSVVPSPSPGPGSSANVLQGVSCASATSCAAVGSYWDNSNGAFKTLVEAS